MGRQIFRVAWEETSRENASDEDSPVTSSSSKISFLQRFHDWCDKWNSALTLFISVVALGISIFALLVSLGQGYTEARRWLEEGARYELSYVVAPSADEGLDLSDHTRFRQSNSVLVVTNTGRTQGTVIEIRAAEHEYDERLTMCVPVIGDNGEIDLSRTNPELPYTDGMSYSYESEAGEESSATIGDSEMTLQPGESRLLFLAGEVQEKGSEMPKAYDGPYDLYTADGEKHTLQPIDRGDAYSNHYKNLPGFNTARRMCLQFAREQPGEQ